MFSSKEQLSENWTNEKILHKPTSHSNKRSFHDESNAIFSAKLEESVSALCMRHMDWVVCVQRLVSAAELPGGECME